MNWVDFWGDGTSMVSILLVRGVGGHWIPGDTDRLGYILGVRAERRRRFEDKGKVFQFEEGSS